MVLETEPQPAENTHSLARIQIRESMQRFQDTLHLDQFFKLTLHDILTSADLKFRFLPQQRTIKNPGLHLNDPNHIPASSELLEHIELEIPVAIQRESGSTKTEPSWSTEGTHPKQLKIRTNPVYNHSEEVISVEQRRLNDFSAYQYFRGYTFEAEISDWHVVMIKTQEKHTALFIGIRWVQNCDKRFRKIGGHRFSDSDWLQQIYKGSNKTKFQYCRDVLLYIRVVQGHTGGNVIALEFVDSIPTAHHIFTCTVVAQTCFYLLSECTVTHWPHAPAWFKSRSTLSASRPKNIYTSSRNVAHLAELDTTHGHSFLTFSWICLPASWTTLRRSTATAEWRFDGTTTLCSLWAQLACWRPGLQALHRRRSVHWTRGFTCETLVFPPVDHRVNL